MKKFTGTGVALVTPFKADGAIDYPALERVIEHVILGNVDYLVVQGTTGESATLSEEEKMEVLAFTKKINRSRVPIVYGLGGNNTAALLAAMDTIDFSEIEGVLSVSPYYNKPSQAGIIAHYEALADKCPVPIILYNVPGRTMSNLSAATTLKLAQHKNIIGIKEASGNLEQCMRIVNSKPDDFLLISGDDMNTTPMRSIGAEGVISVMANAYPEIMGAIIHGNGEYSKKGTFSLLDINPLMYEESNPVGVKCLMEHLGLCESHVRLPLQKASNELRSRIISAADRINTNQFYSPHLE
ncbi:4-hydroxy-tetrahydrodipicolinate synthase [Cyclobacterium marinum]|uniref:4-hydroxy-tetrahydrodipicolinate synthase n=1 Tax=Cyclobacterium marinum (strain ATCC 25205 / DSM 745 / LMG 13164 / NCIMB 1802) TaxID=880070 RepID=G0IXR4_CYCMS|nr:4-hydroxy-tetrahydrodipicolinate synthase [Cyclobacterium marinum]AEL28061.1 Dihydrodipicolinate synthase [Cyclobacterium marinum DSM 745]MBR9777097.1 4-hydroxy-tetrahydrodipicolinate synthase [Cytophagales bacterium]|tara:strand:+ start:27472 stop:28365 length:894 start_codon:yes stop_codon:yes gene_type:complete